MRYFITSLILIVNLILQSTLFQYIEIIDIKPNTTIAIIVAFAFLCGELPGAIIGFAAGLLQDIFFGSYIGMHSMLGMLTGFLCGKFHIGFYKEGLLLPLSLTIISTLFYELCFYILNILIRGNMSVLYFLRAVILPETAYTAIFSVIIYKIIYLINCKLEERERLTRKLF